MQKTNKQDYLVLYKNIALFFQEKNVGSILVKAVKMEMVTLS